jgi:pimeloyl-ACP methyl ester carboxylesterase
LEKVNVYFFSGLGADERCFKDIKLPVNYRVVYIKWIEPYSGENITDYAVRLVENKIDVNSPFVFIGLSMGGIITIELNKFFNPICTFLISSIKTKNELPWLYRMIGKTKCISYLPAFFLKNTKQLLCFLFDIKLPEHKALIIDFVNNTSITFLRWAMQAIATWNNTETYSNIFHIHGSIDKVLFVKKTHPDKNINNAGHFMILTHTNIINQFIAEKIKSISINKNIFAP